MNTENNILIAEFMGLDVAFADTSEPCIMGKQNAWTPIKYHSSYDWLLPAAKKIKSVDFYTECLENNFDLWLEVPVNLMDNIIDSIWINIEALYNAIITFIKWYNENAAKKRLKQQLKL